MPRTARLIPASLLGSALLVVFAAGCSSTMSENDVCAQRKQRYDACPDKSGSSGGKNGFDSTKCSQEYQCVTSVFTSVSADAYFKCQTNQDCSAKVGDNCVTAASQVGSNADEADLCSKKYAECKAQGKSFDDDYCPQFRAYGSDFLSKMAVCLDKPCDQVSSCLKSTFETAAPGCK